MGVEGKGKKEKRGLDFMPAWMCVSDSYAFSGGGCRRVVLAGGAGWIRGGEVRRMGEDLGVVLGVSTGVVTC